jgi:hypothetical protein
MTEDVKDPNAAENTVADTPAADAPAGETQASALPPGEIDRLTDRGRSGKRGR